MRFLGAVVFSRVSTPTAATGNTPSASVPRLGLENPSSVSSSRRGSASSRRALSATAFPAEVGRAPRGCRSNSLA
jgi:hypothetical protein